MKPEYEKAAKGLKDLAQVAAVNCDEESNKAFCGSMGVQGFPTLKIVKPSKKTGKPIVEDYQGPRESKGIIEQVKAAIPNHVKRITDKALSGWLDTGNETTKAILFSNKGTTGALIKVLASDFLNKVTFAQIRDKEKAAVEMFGISEYPTLIVLPGGTKDPVQYDGSFSRTAMKEFVNQHVGTTQGSDQKQKPLKAEKEAPPVEEAAKSKEASSSFSKSSAAHESSEAADEAAGATSVVLEDNSNPTESPEPAVTPEEKPIPVPNQAEPIPDLIEEVFLREKCLGERTSTCVLALLPSVEGEEMLPETATTALASLAELAEKHKGRGSKLFPFFSIPSRNTGSNAIRDSLKLGGSDTFELIALNARRSWWRRFTGDNYDGLAVETWIDNIRFGEGQKERLPEDLLPKTEEEETQTASTEEEEEEPAAPTHGEL